MRIVVAALPRSDMLELSTHRTMTVLMSKEPGVDETLGLVTSRRQLRVWGVQGLVFWKAFGPQRFGDGWPKGLASSTEPSHPLISSLSLGHSVDAGWAVELRFPVAWSSAVDAGVFGVHVAAHGLAPSQSEPLPLFGELISRR